MVDPQVVVERPTFNEWLKVAQAGESFVYFTGFLADTVNRPSDHEKREGELALEAFSRGEVELCQRRIKPSVGQKAGVFEYIAQKRETVSPPKLFGIEPWRTRIGHPWQQHDEPKKRKPYQLGPINPWYGTR
jgi:hypothetical protein